MWSSLSSLGTCCRLDLDLVEDDALCWIFEVEPLTGVMASGSSSSDPTKRAAGVASTFFFRLGGIVNASGQGGAWLKLAADGRLTHQDCPIRWSVASRRGDFFWLEKSIFHPVEVVRHRQGDDTQTA
jgi:hypothetical protein